MAEEELIKLGKKFIELKKNSFKSYIMELEELLGIKDLTVEQLEHTLSRDCFYAGTSHNSSAYEEDITNSAIKLHSKQIIEQLEKIFLELTNE